MYAYYFESLHVIKQTPHEGFNQPPVLSTCTRDAHQSVHRRDPLSAPTISRRRPRQVKVALRKVSDQIFSAVQGNSLHLTVGWNRHTSFSDTDARGEFADVHLSARTTRLIHFIVSTLTE